MELVSSEVPGAANDWGFGINGSGDVGFGDGISAGLDIQFASNNAVNNGTWIFGCATHVKQSGLITIYVNGSAVGSGIGNVGNTLTGNTRILFGYSDDFPLTPYSGLLEGVRLYTYVLPAAQIADLYALGK